jgi:hypothetical protein
VTVELLMHLSRGEDRRLSETLRLVDGTNARCFSRTLELMRVFEHPGAARRCQIAPVCQ